ncbi:Xylan 1,4-beta-xylosidase [Candidatus Sulfotelmatomonas gaucii]|uniref:Xylan 1,4-beta-xylosidase n=1 Tax=Candidatus Sulfuritelmatomonas gaucii TaxID=2043161 RepID=A0A2N9LAQ5_9BACT|nr:Xylan 1,4-beta-xylosidase [Candidatus Sulfotelmatomonas gaucii]
MIGMRMVMTGLVVLGAARLVPAQTGEKPAYLNSNLPAEQRAADLVHRMTLEEKASQLVNQARAIPRLGVPGYDWWSEALHGVAVNDTTEFPEPIGLAATFDTAKIHEMAVDISTEARVVHEQSLAANGGDSVIFHGLDFWAPNINIFRDPRWGRGQETYGEDPFLTARMGVAFVTGMQGDDPHYYRVIATPKHFAVHSGPEPTRHKADVTVSKHDELDTYLPAFRAAVTEGKADSVMCAYNSINGEPACANEFLLDDQLRGKWGFQGYVVSDCGAVRDIFENHHYEPTQAQASAISLERGMDNECVDFRAKVTDDHDYKPYLDAVKEGYLKESEIDTTLIRLFTARVKLGMFDPPEMVPYTKIDSSELNSAAHRELALKLANESMVLLKNDGVLPLKSTGTKILVVGPLADQTPVLLGNYNGIPAHTVSILEGMKKEFAGDTINYVQGTGFLSKQTEPVPNAVLTTEGQPGAKASYFSTNIVGFTNNESSIGTALATRIEAGIDTTAETVPAAAADAKPLTVKWETTLTPKETGDYSLGIETDGFFRLFLDGKSVSNANYPHGVEAHMGQVHLEADQPYRVVVDYQRTDDNAPLYVRLLWHKVDRSVDPAVVVAAQNADVVVAVVGITSKLEGEEMLVSEPGFKGGDRTSLDLPEPERNLLEAVETAQKPLVVVLTNGSALAVKWANEHANAILDAWYPGEEGGTAVAETLSGANDPAGRLPVTFYKSADQLPPFEDYAMKGRTYRYFSGTPLYPFGYGLSYTKFRYSDLKGPSGAVHAGDTVVVQATVTNTGPRASDEVAQLYLSFPPVAGAPLRALRGFERVHLEPGASTTVHFELKPRDLCMVTEAGEPVVAAGDYHVSIGGGQRQPIAGTERVAGGFAVEGTLTLPE